jgi:hypothetical protein
MKSPVIARREFVTEGGEPLVAIVLAPERIQPDEWMCRFRIGRSTHKAYGIDSMQAIMQAIQGIRHALETSTEKVTFLGQRGVGIPRYLPEFGPKFRKHLDVVVAREIAKEHRARKKH